MTRFERDGHSFEAWLERDKIETWCDVLWTRRDDGEPQRGETSYGGRRNYAQLVGEHLRAGWQRIDEAPPTEPRNPELDERMLEDPEATAPIYADWLQQRDHPRGALIAIQLALVARPDDAELRAEEERLVHEVLGFLAKWRAVFDGAPEDGTGLELRWSHGFLEAARIDGIHDDGESEDLLWWLFEDPSARFLRELVIGCHHPGDQDNQLMTTVLMTFPQPPPLRRLYLADFDDTRANNIDISRAWLGDLSGLGKRYPLLEDVTLKGRFNTPAGESFLDDLELPRARRFAMRTSGLRRETLAAILAARWPALGELELWFGDDQYGGNCTVADLAPLLRADGFPALRTLRIMNAPLVADDFVALLADSPRLPALEVLEFSLGGLSDDGAAAIVAARDRFRHLRAIRISDCGVTTHALDALRGAGLALDAQEQGASRSMRYASVTE